MLPKARSMLMLFHFKSHRGTVRAFILNSNKKTFLNAKITKNDQCFGTVRYSRFAVIQKISLQTVKF
jgi:hypothetical protein